MAGGSIGSINRGSWERSMSDVITLGNQIPNACERTATPMSQVPPRCCQPLQPVGSEVCFYPTPLGRAYNQVALASDPPFSIVLVYICVLRCGHPRQKSHALQFRRPPVWGHSSQSDYRHHPLLFALKYAWEPKPPFTNSCSPKNHFLSKGPSLEGSAVWGTSLQFELLR